MSRDVSDFSIDVLARSRTVPVLVDFWAPWCGPCRLLKPVLEKLAAEAAGRWELVKVNTDERQALAEQYNIRGIPDVKLFHDGRVVAEFSGALPERQVRAWLEQFLPSPARAACDLAREQLRAGRFADAERTLAPAHAQTPGEDTVAGLLGLTTVFRDPRAALALVRDRASDDVELVRLFAHVFAIPPASLSESPARLPLLGGLAELRAGRFAEALRLLIASMEESVRYSDSAAKRACLALFKLLGPRHPLSEEYHRRYGMMANS
ncbi:MAG TPA: thioredoxin [Opitutaceae bacterium]|nr:thioredoxin [Opitutaceae bacterium]